MSQSLTLDIATPDGMTALGHSLGQSLFPGSVVALVGQLGAGKTFLTRAIAEGLEIPNSRSVTSPTFVLVQEYSARLPIYHFDAYRLSSEDEFYDLGAHEYFDGEGVCLVEWADKVPRCFPPEHLSIRIARTGETSRTVEITGHGERYELLLEGIEWEK